jgi:PAS domain S-box-containing protein
MLSSISADVRTTDNNIEADFPWRLLDSLPAALYVTDAEGRLTYFNSAAVEFSGRTPRLGSDQWCVSWRLYHTDGRPMPHEECPMATALKEGKAVRGTTAIAERPDGRRIPFMPYPTPLFDGNGTLVGGINLLLDISDRVLAEQTANESKQRYSALAELLPVGMYTCRAPSGEIIYYNEQAARLWGRTPNTDDTEERFCGSWRLWRADGSRLAHEETPMALALREGRAFRNQEVAIERPDGSRITVLVNIDPIRNAQGTVVEAINVFHDITALKEAQKELLLRTQQMTSFLENVSVGLHSVGPDGKILWANRSELNLLGYSEAEYIGRDISEFHADQEAITDILGRLRRHEGIRGYEARLKHKDGSIRNVLIDSTALWDEDRFVTTCCVTRDITEQKQSAQLRAGLAAIVDSTDDAVIGMNLDGIIQSWNKGAETVFGYEATEAIGRHITLVIPEERHAEEDVVLSKMRRGERVRHFETVRRRKNGDLIDISLSVSPVRDEQGRIVGASKIARDITERKRMEAELQEASARKDEFIATLAHELRNPLAPLLSGLQILRMPQGESIKSETLDRMQRQTTQLVHLIDDLLDVSRISNGKLVLQRTRVSVRDVINSAVEIALPNAKAKGQEISVVLPGEQFYLDADETRLCQLLSNLLNNAVKYSACGQSIRLTAAPQGGDLTLTVQDNGIGIPPDYLEKIFEPFSQVPSSQTLNSGLGIGLSLVKRLTELHGGSVEAHSDGPGRGSRFIVRLPMIMNSPVEETRYVEHMHGRRRRILVVDDNRDAADSLGTLLQLLGHQVDIQYDGAGALEAVKRAPPEVVLLDIGMPGMNGYEICSLMKRSTENSPPTVIALTGWGQEGDRKRASDAGFDAHLVKPVDVQTITLALERVSPRQDDALARQQSHRG